MSGRHPLPFLITSTLTRPANTTAYTANQAVASSTVAGSAVIPSFALASLLDPCVDGTPAARVFLS
jgi:hypothetical protein